MIITSFHKALMHSRKIEPGQSNFTYFYSTTDYTIG